MNSAQKRGEDGPLDKKEDPIVRSSSSQLHAGVCLLTGLCIPVPGTPACSSFTTDTDRTSHPQELWPEDSVMGSKPKEVVATFLFH